MEDEDAAFLRIKHYYVNETARRRAHQNDLGFKHFTEDELYYLGLNTDGKVLLIRMRDGDEAAVAPAKALVKKIKRKREDLDIS